MALRPVPAKLPEIPKYIDTGGVLNDPVGSLWASETPGYLFAPPEGATADDALALQKSRVQRIHEAFCHTVGMRLCRPSSAVSFGPGNDQEDLGLHFDGASATYVPSSTLLAALPPHF